MPATAVTAAVVDPAVTPSPWPGLWRVTWEQDTADAGGWCECPWELWRLGAHVCNASKRLLDGWQVTDAPVLRAAQRRR
jgi:hypothetical protein